MLKHLRELRVSRGINQNTIAEYLHCSQVCYSGYEIGRSDIPTYVFIKLAAYYRTSVDYLLDITDEGRPHGCDLRLAAAQMADKSNAVYKRLRDLREDSDIKQREISEFLGCSQVSYSYYEIGRRDMPPGILIKLAAYYGTSVDFLLGLTNDRTPYPKRRSREFEEY